MQPEFILGAADMGRKASYERTAAVLGSSQKDTAYGRLPELCGKGNGLQLACRSSRPPRDRGRVYIRHVRSDSITSRAHDESHD